MTMFRFKICKELMEEGFSFKEAIVAEAVAHGFNNEEIGNLLGITPRAVGYYLTKIYARIKGTSKWDVTQHLIVRLNKGVTVLPPGVNPRP